MKGSASPSMVSVLAVLLIGASGCTICPDPFDYSGPVPNGSAPQNDFRARSGGIAPLDGVPRPWPPVVQASPESGGESPAVLVAAKSIVNEPAAQATESELELEREPEPESNVEPAAAEAPAAECETAPVSPVEAEPAPPQPQAEPAIDDMLPPVRPPRAAIAPPLRETPGWRPRD